MMVVPIETEPTFTYRTPQLLFSGRYSVPGSTPNFDISPNGERFLMIKDAAPILEPSARDEITVVLNWFEELKRLVPPTH